MKNWSLVITYSAGIYLLKVNHRNTKTRCEICSKLTLKNFTPCSSISIVNFEQVNANWICIAYQKTETHIPKTIWWDPGPETVKYLKVVFAIFLLIYFVCLKESTCKTRTNVVHLASKPLFVLEIMRNNFSEIQMSWHHQMSKHEKRNTFYETWEVNTAW